VQPLAKTMNLFGVVHHFVGGNWLALGETLPCMAIHRPNKRFYYTDTFH
jgi:hypothetical protein